MCGLRFGRVHRESRVGLIAWSVHALRDPQLLQSHLRTQWVRLGNRRLIPKQGVVTNNVEFFLRSVPATCVVRMRGRTRDRNTPRSSHATYDTIVTVSDREPQRGCVPPIPPRAALHARAGPEMAGEARPRRTGTSPAALDAAPMLTWMWTWTWTWTWTWSWTWSWT